MTQYLEMIGYVVVGAGLLIVNHLWLADMPELKVAGVALIGAAIGFARGSYVPPLTGK